MFRCSCFTHYRLEGARELKRMWRGKGQGTSYESVDNSSFCKSEVVNGDVLYDTSDVGFDYEA